MLETRQILLLENHHFIKIFRKLKINNFNLTFRSKNYTFGNSKKFND